MSALEVFQRDTAALNEAEAIVAHVGLPSTGVGAELAIAASAKIGIIGIARNDEAVSRFAEGLIIESGGRLFRFDDETDLFSQLRCQIRSLAQARHDRVAS